jgi:hypothetical protein
MEESFVSQIFSNVKKMFEENANENYNHDAYEEARWAWEEMVEEIFHWDFEDLPETIIEGIHDIYPEVVNDVRDFISQELSERICALQNMLTKLEETR